MRFLLVIFFVLFIASFSGCTSNKPYSEEDLLRLAFEALKERQWEQYKNLIITSADFFLYEGNITAFEEPGTYLGSVIRPEQIEIHKHVFFQAMHGGRGYIDFSRAEFCQVGSLLRTELKLLEGKDPVSLNTYSLIITNGETEFDTKDLYPHFTVVYVPWMGQYRIIDLEVSNAKQPR